MKIPFKEMLGAVPGFVGIRLEEEPEYDVSLKDGHFEIRHYKSMVLAQTTVSGNHEEALDEGFDILATYIFGGNKSAQTMSMTTPVLQAKTDSKTESKTMSMTTPVLQERSSAGWTMSFVLEKEFTESSAPRPNDPRVKLVTVPAKTVAVYRYSGNNTESQIEASQAKLLDWVKAQKKQTVGEVQWGQYDQPFAIPMFKRNEAQIEIL